MRVSHRVRHRRHLPHQYWQGADFQQATHCHLHMRSDHFGLDFQIRYLF